MMDELIMNDLKENLTPKRLRHCMDTAQTAVELARKWNADEEKCMIAGLLHDCGNYSDKQIILSKCEEYKIVLSEDDIKCPQVIHAYLSENIARDKYNISDEEILKAIKNHTLGCEHMGVVEKIIFVADIIEPGKIGYVFQKIREEAYIDLDKAVLMVYNETIKYNKRKGNYIHKRALHNKNKLSKKERI